MTAGNNNKDPRLKGCAPDLTSLSEQNDEKRLPNLSSGLKIPEKRRGFWGRLIDRLVKANQREFGSGRPCGH